MVNFHFRVQKTTNILLQHAFNVSMILGIKIDWLYKLYLFTDHLGLNRDFTITAQVI